MDPRVAYARTTDDVSIAYTSVGRGPTIERARLGAWLGLVILLAACGSTVPSPTNPPAPSPVGTPSASAAGTAPSPFQTPETGADHPLGAGFRFSTYGPAYDPGPDYWAAVGREMAERFEDARPQAIWIVGNFSGIGTVLTFPGTHPDRRIAFTADDKNEAALTSFDEAGLDVWLQVEPGDAPVDELIDLMLDRYGDHPSVIGVGVDVEWFHSDGTPEGEPVSDADAQAWVAAARSHDPDYRVFLKHWEQAKLPPTQRDGLVFVDDSQQFRSLDEMVDEFAAWGAAYTPSPVAFQYGYPADETWWGKLADPPGDIGAAILDAVPNTEALFWVDFTVLQVFPPDVTTISSASTR